MSLLFRSSLRLTTTTTRTIKNELNIAIKQQHQQNKGILYLSTIQPVRSYSQLMKKNLSISAGTRMALLQQQQQQQIINKQLIRTIVSQEITKNLQLFSSERKNLEHDYKTLKLNVPINKPLVLMFSWLQAKQKHLSKYAEIYTKQGYDVLVVSITPWQLMWPVKGSQRVANDVVNFLYNNTNFNPMLIHGFSVGGYVFGECLVIMARELDKYQPLLNKFIGQIWDSAADITEIHIGVPKAMFPTNMTLQSTLKKYMMYHLKTFHEPATSHYIRSSQMFHSTLLKAPAQFFLSNTDPIGASDSNKRVCDSWKSLGIKCDWQCWDKSPHVGHYTKHKDEYLQILFTFLQTLNTNTNINNQEIIDNELINNNKEEEQNKLRAKL